MNRVTHTRTALMALALAALPLATPAAAQQVPQRVAQGDVLTTVTAPRPPAPRSPHVAPRASHATPPRADADQHVWCIRCHDVL